MNGHEKMGLVKHVLISTCAPAVSPVPLRARAHAVCMYSVDSCPFCVANDVRMKLVLRLS